MSRTLSKMLSRCMPKHNQTFVVLLACLLANTCFTAQAAQETSTADGGSLKGGVREIEVTLDDLRDARLSTSRVRKAAANLYDEVTRQEMTMMMNPNVIGTMVISTPRPVPTGRLLEARKKWVDASMAEIAPIIKLFKEDVDKAIEDDRRADVSDSSRKSLDAVRDDLFALVNASFEIYKSLEGLTAGPTYDNKAIASDAKQLDENMKKLDRSLKKGVSILQKEAKASRKK